MLGNENIGVLSKVLSGILDNENKEYGVNSHILVKDFNNLELYLKSVSIAYEIIDKKYRLSNIYAVFYKFYLYNGAKVLIKIIHENNTDYVFIKSIKISWWFFYRWLKW